MKHRHHIVPKHMGGSDDSSNITLLTVEDHAEAHRKLYEKHGNWQDYLAWQGLAGLKSNDKCYFEAMSNGGKRGGKTTNERYPKRKHLGWYDNRIHPTMDQSGENNPNSKQYLIITPNGEVENTNCLKTYCDDNDLNYKSFHKGVVQRKRSYKNYKLWG